MTPEKFLNEASNTSQKHKRRTFSVPLNYDLNTPPVLNPPRVECHLDKETFVRNMVYIGTLHHDQLILQVFDIWSQIPDLEKYDNIIDMRFHNGDVGWHTVKEIGKQWNLRFEGHPPNKRTAFVSNHTAFTILIKAIRAFAPEHTFQTFPSKPKALAWLQNKS
ncbi:MAG: hypothetical protein V7776_09670 [Halopseudomonas aestusnigri]